MNDKNLLNYFDVLKAPKNNKGKFHKLNDIIMSIFVIFSNCKGANDKANNGNIPYIVSAFVKN